MEQTGLNQSTPTTALWLSRPSLLASLFAIIASLAGVLLGAPAVLPVAVFISIITLYALFRRPLLLLSLLIVVRMLLDYSSQSITFTLLERTLSLSQHLGVGIALLGILFMIRHASSLTRYPLLLPYGLLILWGLTTLVYSIAPATSAQEALRIFDLLVVGFIAYVSVGRYRDYRFLLTAIFVSSLIPILFGLYQFTFGIGLADENVSAIRIFGTFSHPNVFSLYLFTVAAVASIYYLVFARKDNARLLSGLYIGLVLLTLLLTYARIAWIALFVFVFFVAIWRFRFLILPLILLPIVLATFVPAIGERVQETFNPTPDSSVIWRQNLWNDMLLQSRFDDREFLGTGLDTFRVSAEALRGDRFGSTESHNDFVKFYIDGGLIGLAIFLLYLLTFIFPAWQVRGLTPSHSLRNMATLLVLLVLTLTIASLSDNVFKNTPVQWILAIVMGGFLKLYSLSLPKSLTA